MSDGRTARNGAADAPQKVVLLRPILRAILVDGIVVLLLGFFMGVSYARRRRGQWAEVQIVGPRR